MATKVYKLTTESGLSRPGWLEQLQWGENVEHTAKGPDTRLCTDGMIHAFRSPLQAAFCRSVYVNDDMNTLWEAEIPDGVEVSPEESFHNKVAAKKMKTIKKVELPKIEIQQWIAFGAAILENQHSSLASDPVYKSWIDDYLSGKDRSAATAEKILRENDESLYKWKTLLHAVIVNEKIGPRRVPEYVHGGVFILKKIDDAIFEKAYAVK